MKTVFIDCSPKRKFSASGFVASMTSVFVPGIKKKMKLRTKADHEAILTELTDADAVVLLFGSGIIIFDIWLASCIRRKKTYGKHYTRIMLPSFVFIICADLFFIIISIVKGGIFRGWFSKKKPS